MSATFEFMVNLIADYMYICFGPLLLTLSAKGLFAMPGIALDCHVDSIGGAYRITDLFCLLFCFALSFAITCMYGL